MDDRQLGPADRIYATAMLFAIRQLDRAAGARRALDSAREQPPQLDRGNAFGVPRTSVGR